jgi:hypothetical protein
MRKLGYTLLGSLLGASLLIAAPAAAKMPPGMIVASKQKFPGSDGMQCTRHTLRGERRATVCYDAFNTLGGSNNGFWVKDEAPDGYSAVASFTVPAADGRPNPVSGYCRNRSNFTSP